jgi:16S rRNA (guanine527-N7)-methyltransferase
VGVALHQGQLDRFQRYLDLLVDGNRRANLISVASPDEIWRRHFLDSITLVVAIPPERISRSSLLDLGSGAGFPGLPLAIAFPDCRVTLIEATGKKATFLQTVKGELDVDNVTVVEGRSEALAHDPTYRESFDIVAARALARMDTLAELMLPFCLTGGVAVAYKGRGAGPEIAAASGAIAATGGGDASVVEVTDVTGVQDSGARLVVIPKLDPTPERYPRRAGIPGKRPL